jgi:hypothetical protein
VASILAKISPPITSFLFSLRAVGGSGTVGFTKAILEVDGISEEKATYPSLVLSVGLF